ncbi:MAG TPA: GNAT family N-acetyltransferase [Micromonosporaceae bacterium]|nr:GNAT family N-acetyltransferase [Micromonosporaceae bacterium]
MPVTVVNNPERERYEAVLNGQIVGFAQYRVRPYAVELTHVEVDEAYEGQGIGSAIARAALDDIRAQGAQVVPVCPFVASYVRRHPAYSDLVADRARDTGPGAGPR